MNTQSQRRLTPYTIIWFTMIPLKGIVTKKDAKIIGGMRGIFGRLTEISQHNATKELAISRLEALKGKLGKPYQVFMYTDKQFGMRHHDQPVTSILTSKQAGESYIIQ